MKIILLLVFYEQQFLAVAKICCGLAVLAAHVQLCDDLSPFGLAELLKEFVLNASAAVHLPNCGSRRNVSKLALTC
jgi:hypothetical protein